MKKTLYKELLDEKLKKNPFYTLEKAVYDILLEQIITFRIAPGTKLVEYQLAEEFGISRSPIREAVIKLEEQGFVRKENNKKIVVDSLDTNEYNELIQFRCILEPAATALASQIITEDELKQVKEYADLLNDAYKNDNFGMTFEYENLFHEFIIQCSHNRYIINAYKRIQPYLTRSRAAYLYMNKNLGPEICAEEHYLIYNSLMLRNKDLTENVVRQLLEMLLIPTEEAELKRITTGQPYTSDLVQKKYVVSALVNLNKKLENLPFENEE